MANGNKQQTITQKITTTLTNVCAELWKQISGTFATKTALISALNSIEFDEDTGDITVSYDDGIETEE